MVPRFRRVSIRSPSGKHLVTIRSAFGQHRGKRLVNIRSSPGHGPVNVRSMSGSIPPSSGSFLFPRGRPRLLPARAGLGAPGRLGSGPFFLFTMSKSDPPAVPGVIEHIWNIFRVCQAGKYRGRVFFWRGLAGRGWLPRGGVIRRGSKPLTYISQWLSIV